MKKTLIITLLLFVIINQQSCGNTRKATKSHAKVDSTKVVTTNAQVKQFDKDSAASFSFDKWVNANTNIDMSIEKIKRTVETEPGDLKFVLNVEQLKVTGDSMQAEDIATGAKATIFKDKTGNILFDIKQPGRRKETYEMQGMKLQKKNSIDSGSKSNNNTALRQSGRDSSYSSIDSVQFKSDIKAVQKEFKKTGGFLKWIGIIVIILAVLRRAIWLFRNQFSFLTWLNNKLKF